MPDNPIEAIADIVEDVKSEATSETLAAIQQAEQAAQIDRIEEKLESVEEKTPETPISSPDPVALTEHSHPEIISAIADLGTRIDTGFAALQQSAIETSDAAIDTTADVSEGVAAGATDVAENVEQAPRRVHPLFKKLFG